MALRLLSLDFADGQPIPLHSPHLRWSGAPTGTREFALVCEDPDSPTLKPVVHWLVHEIDATVTELPPGLERHALLEWPVHIKQGMNSFLFAGYTGPNLGIWERPHRYVFRLFALADRLDLPDLAGRSEFMRALQGKVLEEARLTGLYRKTPARMAKGIALWTAGLGAVTWVTLRLRRQD